jgi:hypothetical protein
VNANADLARAGTAFGSGLTLAAVGSVTTFIIISKVTLFFSAVQPSPKNDFSILTGYVWKWKNRGG